MNFKKLFQSTTVLGICAAMAACSSGGTASGGETKTDSGSSSGSNKITVWCWDENFNIKAMEEAKQLYQKSHPDVEIVVENVDQDSVIQKLNTAFTSGVTDTLPNIVLIEDYRIQGYLQSYKDAFEDLSDVVKAEDFASYKMAVNTLDSKVYGVPFDSGITGLYVRTDILQEAGVTVQDLTETTWTNYIEVAKKVKDKTGKQALTLDPNDSGMVRMMMQSAGTWFTGEDGKTVTVKDNAPLKEAFETIKAMKDAGIVKDSSSWETFVSAFQNGDVWSIPTGCWISPTVQGKEDQSGKWQIVQLPRLANEKATNYSACGGAGWYVVKGKAGNDVAKDFLKTTFASDTTLMNQLVTDISLVSTLKAAASTENYKLPSAFFANTPVFETFSNWSNEIPNVNYGLHTYLVGDIVVKQLQQYLNGTDLDTALDTAQKEAEGKAK